MLTFIVGIGCLARPRALPDGRMEWSSLRDSVLGIIEGQIVFEDEEIAPKEHEAIIDVGGRLVTPGLIDAHTHPVFGGNRASEFAMRCEGLPYEAIAAKGGGIQSSVRSTRGCKEAELDRALSRHLDWMLASGTTTLEAKSGYGLSMESELAQLESIERVAAHRAQTILPTLLAAHAVGPEFEGNRHAYMQHVIHDILPEVAKRGLAKFVDIFVERGYFEPTDARDLAYAARVWGLGLRMHVDQLTNSGGAQLAAELGAISADHLEMTDSIGIAALKASQTVPVLLPASVYGLGKSHYPNARAMLDAGLPVALATDFNPGTSPTPSLPFVMSLACTQMKMTPEEVWLGVTTHAARSLGLPRSFGTFEYHAKADFVVWDVDDWREIPYWIGAPVVHSVYIGGKCVYQKA